MTPIQDLVNTWIHIGQLLAGSIGTLAFILALLCMSQTLLLVLGLRPFVVGQTVTPAGCSLCATA